MVRNSLGRESLYPHSSSSGGFDFWLYAQYHVRTWQAGRAMRWVCSCPLVLICGVNACIHSLVLTRKVFLWVILRSRYLILTFISNQLHRIKRKLLSGLREKWVKSGCVGTTPLLFRRLLFHHLQQRVCTWETLLLFTPSPLCRFVKFSLILIKLLQRALQPSRSGCASTVKASLHYFAASHASVEGRENIS